MNWERSWPSLELKQSRDSLLELRALVALGSAEDASVLAQLARFLTIRSTGHVEFTFDKCVQHYAEAKSHPNIVRYVTSSLFRGKSVRPNILIERMDDVDATWAVELTDFLKLDDEQLYRELAFMVDKRNRIAHGQNHGLGTKKAIDLCDVAVAVADWIVKRMDPRT